MQGTSNFHNQIPHSMAQEATDVFEDAAAFDTTVDVFDGNPAACQSLIGGLLRGGQLAASGLPGGHFDGDSLQGESEKAEVLKQVAARR